MNRRFLQLALKYLVLVAISLACIACTSHPHASEAPPNIVLIFIDDMGYGDLGSYGLTTARTPNLDQLASEGTRFTSFYAQHLCGPSRMSLLTGRYPARVNEPRWSMSTEEITFAELLKQAGYRSACIGKWDVSGRKAIRDRMPNAQGFDYYWGTLGSNDAAVVDLYENTTHLGQESDMSVLTRVYTDRAIGWMNHHRQDHGNKPFLLYLSHTMMHTVIDASADFRGRTGNGLYADTLEEMDHECGRLFKAIDELDIADQTLVIFTSDNGPWSNDQSRQFTRHEELSRWSQGPKVVWGDAGPLREGKGSDYEGGVRVPCLVRWPGKVPSDRENPAIIATLDLLPTFASLVDVDIPADRTIDGVDQSDLLLGKSDVGHRNTFFYFSGTHGVREGEWKLLYPNRWPKSHKGTYPKDKGAEAVELYNLDLDIGETSNVADEYPEIVERLLQLKLPSED